MKKETRRTIETILLVMAIVVVMGFVVFLVKAHSEHSMYDFHGMPSNLVGYISEEPRPLENIYRMFSNHLTSDVQNELDKQVADGVLVSSTENIDARWYSITDYGREQLDKWGRIM